MVLFLVDGRRDVTQVQQMAAAAGAAESVLVELMDLGLVSLRERDDMAADSPSQQAAAQSPSATEVVAYPTFDSHGRPITAEKPTGAPPQQVPVLNAVVEGYTTLQQTTEQDALLDPTHPLNQAREMLLRALMEHAPVAGSITRMRVKKAQSIAEITALLDEVERHISRPKRQLVTQQLISNVKQLLILAGSR